MNRTALARYFMHLTTEDVSLKSGDGRRGDFVALKLGGEQSRPFDSFTQIDLMRPIWTYINAPTKRSICRLDSSVPTSNLGDADRAVLRVDGQRK